MINNNNFYKKLLLTGELSFFTLLFLTPFITSFSLPVSLITTKLLWFSFCAICFISIVTFNFFLQNEKTKIQLHINLIDLCVILFILYVHLNFLFLGESYTSGMLTPFSLILCLYLILKFKLQQRVLKINEYIKHLPFVLALLSSLIGLYQIFQIYYLKKPLQVNGFMGNSGAFSSYLAIITSLMLVFVGSIHKVRLKYFYTTIIITTLLVILFTKGRASWVASSLVGLFIAFHTFKTHIKELTSQFKKYRLVIIGGSLCFILISSFFIFNLKKDSSNGRILIWKITTEMIKETPLLGVGFGNFGSTYPLHQASYLRANKDEPMQFLANDINHPFNEYLFTTAELGLIGFVLFFAIFFAIVYYKPKSNKLLLAAYSSILCFLILSLFTYPFKIFSIQFLVFCFIAIISSQINKKHLFVLKKNVLSIVFICTTILSFLVFKTELNRFQLEKEWNKTNKITKSLTWKSRAKELSSLYGKNDIQNWSILMNYGVELISNKEYHKAIEVLEKSSKYFKTSDLYLNLGIAYENIKKRNEAEQAYLTAMHIVPHKFLPKYRLVLLYNDVGLKNKAQELAKNILQTPAKINSTTVVTIKYEMRKFLKNN